MAVSAKGNQVQILIVPLLTAQLFVVNLQISSRTARLAPPAIPACRGTIRADLVLRPGQQPAFPARIRPSDVSLSDLGSHRRRGDRFNGHLGHLWDLPLGPMAA